jgi:hypothetical protein
MTLTGPHKGKTKLFGKYYFVKGMCDYRGTPEQIANVTKYFVRCYQVKVTKPGEEEANVPEPTGEEGQNIDDSEVISDEDLEAQAKEAQEKIDHPEPEQPNKRQADIIAAINGIEKEDYVDLTAKTPRPRVKDVQVLMEDPTVNKNEIIEVIEKWLS